MSVILPDITDITNAIKTNVQTIVTAAVNSLTATITNANNLPNKQLIINLQADLDAFEKTISAAVAAIPTAQVDLSPVMAALNALANTIGLIQTNDAAIKADLDNGLVNLSTAVAGVQAAATAIKTDLDTSVTAIQAAIAKIPTGGGGGGGNAPWTRLPANAAEQPFMPWNIPAVEGPPAPRVPPDLGNGVFANATIAAGTFYGAIDLVGPAVLNGAGMGQTILDLGPSVPGDTTGKGVGYHPLYGKAVVVMEAGSPTLSNVTIRGATTAASNGANAAGVCNGANGDAATYVNVEIYGCEEGFRHLGGLMNVTGCVVRYCGADSQNDGGDTHNVYLQAIGPGTDNSVITWTNAISHSAVLAHCFKTRMKSHIMQGNIFYSRVITGSQGSYTTGPTTILGGNGECVNNANGGDWQGKSNLYIIDSGCANRVFYGMGEEDLWAGYSGVALEDGSTFVNNTGKTCYFTVESGCTLTVNNPTFVTQGGTAAEDPQMNGNATLKITGTVTRMTVAAWKAANSALFTGTGPTVLPALAA